MKLSAHNFQCWAELSFDIEGLTVLVGPSNNGKSSASRALKGIIRNEMPEEFIRNNQDEPLEISLTLNDGRVIKSERKRGGSTKYFIFPSGESDPEKASKYSSLGGKVPEEIKNLNMGEVKIGDYTLDPIFSIQNRAQFLIDSDRWKATELNSILGAFSSTEKLEHGKKEANIRVSQRKSEASTLASEIRSAEERSAKLLEISGDVAVVFETVSSLEKCIRNTELIAGQLGSSIHHRSRMEPLQEILDTLIPPDLTEVTTVSLKAENMMLAANYSAMSGFLRNAEASLDEVVKSWNDLLARFKKNRAIEELFSLLGKAGRGVIMEYADGLSVIVDKIESELSVVNTLNDSISYLREAADSTKTRSNLSANISEIDTQIEEAELELELARKKVAEESARKEAAELAIRNRVCPTCGGVCSKCGSKLESA